MGISLSNYLSGAASALTNAAGGNQAGQLQGTEMNQGNLLTALQLARQQAQDQLARQSAQSRMALEAAQGNEAAARAKSILTPPPKGSVTLGPGQNEYGPNGELLTQGPPVREDPAVAAAERNAATLAAQDARQRAALAAQAGQQDKNAAAKEYTDALTGYQQVEAANPSLKNPLTTKLFGGVTGTTDTFAANKSQAETRVKAAWHAYKNAGGNPGDIPELGLTSTGTTTQPPTNPGTKPTARDIVHAAINGQPLPPD